MTVDNRELYDTCWPEWLDMKKYGPASRWLRRLIESLVAHLKDAARVRTILDVGCGEGINTCLLARRFPQEEVTGIDISQTGIMHARVNYQLPNLRFFHADLDSLNSRYDLVTCFEVLEHVPDWQEFLGKMVQASQKYLMLSFPTGRMRKFEINMGHLRNFQKFEVEHFLASFQVQPVKVYYAGFPFYSPLYRELCNLFNIGQARFTRGRYGWSQKFSSTIFFILFSHFSTRDKHGDQFCGLFIKKT